MLFQIRNVIRAIRASPQRRQLWYKTVHLVHPKPVDGSHHIPEMPKLDVRTRWGSTHDMLRETLNTLH